MFIVFTHLLWIDQLIFVLHKDFQVSPIVFTISKNVMQIISGVLNGKLYFQFWKKIRFIDIVQSSVYTTASSRRSHPAHDNIYALESIPLLNPIFDLDPSVKQSRKKYEFQQVL